MPQADVLSFGPTLLFLPVSFLGGYFFFLTYWVPRLMLTLKARAWLTGFEVRLLPLGALTPGTDWPEIFLMFLQFGGLLYFVSTLTLVAHPPEQKIFPLRGVTSSTATFDLAGGGPAENFFLLWGTRRGTFLFRPAGAELTLLVGTLLGGFSFFAPGKQFPLLGARLRGRLSREARAVHLG